MNWKDIRGYEGFYQVSDQGDVLSVATNRPRVPFLHPSGYLGVNLYKRGKGKYHLIHRLVAESFLPNEGNKREVNHKDGDKENNYDSNLEWATTSENVIHALKCGLMKSGERHVQSKLTTEQVDYIKTNFKQRDATFGGKALAKMFGVSRQLISAVVTGSARKWG